MIEVRNLYFHGEIIPRGEALENVSESGSRKPLFYRVSEQSTHLFWNHLFSKQSELSALSNQSQGFSIVYVYRRVTIHTVILFLLQRGSQIRGFGREVRFREEGTTGDILYLVGYNFQHSTLHSASDSITRVVRQTKTRRPKTNSPESQIQNRHCQ